MARRRRWVRRIIEVLAALAAITLALGGAARFGARTDQGRALIVRALDGLDLGPLGRLHVAGLKGDVFDAFSVQTLALDDAGGAWLTADRLAVVWSPLDLLGRRLHIRRLTVGLVRILRAPEPTQAAGAPPGKPPVSVLLESASGRLQTAKAFSVQEGDWDVFAQGDLARSGAVRARLSARSRLHVGDGVDLILRVGRRDRFVLRAAAVESRGGALAGALGLPADHALRIEAVGDGTARQGLASASVVSGAAQLVKAQTRWSRESLAVDGNIDLTASRLTQLWARKLGPRIEFKGAGRALKGATYQCELTLDGALGHAHAVGPVDLKRRLASNMRLDVSVADLSKWVPVPKIGYTQASGVLNASPSGFSFKGPARGRDLDQWGYAAQTLSGTIGMSWKDRIWRFQGDFTGSGGRAAPFVASLLGSSPHAAFDISLLRDGRLMISNLALKGVQMSLNANGGQGLLGRLSLKGSMRVANLAVLRPGAHGTAEATWSAGEKPDATAWDFQFTAQGRQAASGFADLDHLLGASPQLDAEGSFSLGSGLTVRSAKIIGSALQIQGKGALDAAHSVSADFNWSAKGPFAAGPLELAGAAKGEGRLSGALGAPRADVSADLAVLNLGQLSVTPAHVNVSLLLGSGEVTGVGEVSGATSKYGPAVAKTAFRFGADALYFTDLVADAGGVKLAGAVTLRNAEPSSADLTFSADQGAFLTTGHMTGSVRLADKGAQPIAKVVLSGTDLSIPGQPIALSTLNLTGEGPLDALPFKVSIASRLPTSWSFAGAGVYGREHGGARLSLQGQGKVRQATFKFLEPAVLRFSGLAQTLHARLAVAGGAMKVDLSADAAGVLAHADLANVGLGAFDQSFAGLVSGAVSLEGRGPNLAGDLNVELAGVRSTDEPPSEGLNGTVKASLEAGRLKIQAGAVNAQGLKASGQFDLPADAAAAPFHIALNPNKPLHGSFSAEGDIRPLWDLFAGGERTLSGRVSTAGTLAGTLNTLVATGQGALTQGRFRDVSTGLELQNLQVDTAFGDDGLTVKRFSGADARGGAVDGQGAVSFAEGGASTFTLNLKHFQLLDNDLGRATASGAVTVTHPAKGQGKLTGSLSVDRADIVAATPTPTGVVPMDVVEIHQTVQDGDEAAPTRALGPPILLDVTIKAPRGVYVKGRGLNVELSLDAHVGGDLANPSLGGVARVVAGNYDFAGKRFDVDNAGVINLGSSPSEIRLDLSATWQDPTITALVQVRGTAAKPEIKLTSVPVLPQDEVLSRVLFGESASQLAPAQAAELASALASLAGGGGFDVIGNLRQFAGLDRLALGSTQAAVTTISGGKYINKNVYLELTGGARNGSGAQVEWRIRRNLSIVSRYGAALDPRYPNDSDASLSVRFRKDF